MKKRIILSVLIFVLIPAMVFAANMQRVYTTRDDIYQRVDALCMRAGVIGPSSFSPMPARGLEIALERIDRSKLSLQDRAEYDYLAGMLAEREALYSDGYFRFDIGTGLNFGINVADYSDFNYAHTGSEAPQWDHRENTLVPFRYEKGLFSLTVDMEFGDSVYLGGKLDIKNPSDLMYESTLGILITGNLPDGRGLSAGISSEWPQQAGMSIGNDYISFILGRFPHSIGSGITGNLMVGDNFNYQEVVLFSLLSNHFSYNISVTRFDQQAQASSDPDNWNSDFTRSKFSGPQQFRVVHRFDITLFDKMRLALDLGTIYESTNGLDFRFFAPFVVSHNYWNYSNSIGRAPYDEANNFMTLSTEWNIAKGISLTAQLAIDQYQTFWESEADLPLAFGALANLRWSASTESGNRLSGWVEAVYTNPYLYLNGKRTTPGVENSLDYNLDYIVGYNSHHMDDYGWSGYIYGPDNIVFSTGMKYQQKDDEYELGGNIMYKVQGEKGLRHRANSMTDFELDMSHAVIESDSGTFMSNLWTPSGGWRNAEHLVKLALYGRTSFDASSWGAVSIYGALGANFYHNFNHIPGADEFQPQLMFGIMWEI